MYTEGLDGVNILLIKMPDAGIISDLMMGGDGSKKIEALTELEISAVSEAMNQMIGSSATSLATMLGTPINISPPVAMVWDDKISTLSAHIDENEQIVKISFRLTIGDLIDSEIMLLFNINTTKTIITKMTGGSSDNIVESNEFDFGNIPEPEEEIYTMPKAEPVREVRQQQPQQQQYREQPVNVQKAQFSPLSQSSAQDRQNIDLILDVPLEISVVLGRTKKTIKEILSLGTGSLVELEKLTEEPVEILVNGKKIALGEVVVIDENFGVRITNIISNSERVRSLQNR
jgi:flagellar motor switch protein FliN/FliY